jgi:hypothetical protein
MDHETIPFQKIAIKAPNGRFLQVLGESGVIKAGADVIDTWETFIVHPCNGSSHFAMQSHFGGYLCAENGINDVIANRDKVDEWEKFRFCFIEKDQGNSSIWRGYFQTFNGSYLTINHEHSHFTANTRKKDEAAIFEVICRDAIDINDNDDGLPTAIVLGSAAAGGTLCAIPIVAVATVQSMGFGASGIVAGSSAVAMMSAEAIAAGGAVAGGGTVATLQSVGAIGMAGALPVAGIVLLSLSGGLGLAFGIWKGVTSFTDRPRESPKPKQVSFPFKKVAIKAHNGHFLTALGGGKGNWFFNMLEGPCYTGIIKAEANHIKEWEIFTVHPFDGSDLFALQSHHGAFLYADHGVNDVTARSHNLGEWESFHFTLADKEDTNSSVWRGYFQSFNGHYMTINHSHCHFTANTRNRDEAAIFEVIRMD